MESNTQYFYTKINFKPSFFITPNISNSVRNVYNTIGLFYCNKIHEKTTKESRRRSTSYSLRLSAIKVINKRVSRGRKWTPQTQVMRGEVMHWSGAGSSTLQVDCYRRNIIHMLVCFVKRCVF